MVGGQVPVTIPASDKIVQQIVQSSEAIVIPPVCALGKASNHRVLAGAMAAVRLPLLYVSNFKGGTPEVVSASYAILVLVLPGETGRVWTAHEIELVEVVADQVSAVLEVGFRVVLGERVGRRYEGMDPVEHVVRLRAASCVEWE